MQEKNRNETSLSLLESVKGGDQEAWTKFIAIYAPLVNYWCSTKARLSSEDASDVTQEVFLAVSRSIKRFRYDAPDDSLRGWLRVVTLNKIRNHISKKAKQPVGVGGTSAHAFMKDIPDELLCEDAAEESIVTRRVVELIRAQFEESTYQAFWQVHIEGKPTDLVADAIGISVQAVRQACYRVRRRLKSEMTHMQVL